MDCNKTKELLNAYVDKELSKSDTTLLESHLADCNACMGELEDIRRLDARARADVSAPAELRSAIADKLEQRRTASSRVSIKEMLGMRYRMGLAAMLAAGLIVVGVMSTGGNAQAAYTRMKNAVTAVTSMHLRVEFAPDAMNHMSSDLHNTLDGDKDEDNDPEDMGSAMLKGISTMGTGSVDVWSKDNMFRVSAFGGIDVSSKDGKMTVMFGDKVVFSGPADGKDIPKNLGETLFKEFSKATDEIKQHFNVVSRGTVRENGRVLSTLEVTGKDEGNKDFRLMYWVDQDTNLPARFQVFGTSDTKSDAKLICTITCEYNENYPDSMFEPGGEAKP